jgi:uncharacterized repeat protein (TIGR01451 family)
MKHLNVSSKWRRLLVAVLLGALGLLGVLVTFALAQTELPPQGSAAFIQTSGPNTPLGTGDWYTNGGQGNHPHNFKIFVPCTITPSAVLTVDLFDPELYPGGTTIDEIRDAANNATQNPADADDSTFELLAPNNVVVAARTFTPTQSIRDDWVTFATFTVGQYGCGIYTLLASTSDNDDNSWRMRVTHPDAIPGSGDEPTVAAFETSFQHAAPDGTLTCQNFYFFVPVTPSIRLNNFDLDVPGYTPNATVTYFRADGSSPGPSTTSGNARWNNCVGSAAFCAANRAGDVFTDPMPGWWRAEICIGPGNQYIFEPEGLAFLLQQPDIPTMTVSKDDSLTVVAPGQIVTYTIVYTNIGTGAALNPTLLDTLPVSTTFVSCSGGLSCGEVPPPGSGVVSYSLATVPAGTGGQVTLTVQVDPDAPPSLVLTNTVQLSYEDTMGNGYPPVEDTDVDVIPETLADLSIVKSDEPDPVAVGNTLTYTLVIANAGPDDAQNVVVTDTLPAGVTLISVTPSQGQCVGTTCNLGTIAVGGQASIVVVVSVNDGTTGPLLNFTRVSSDTPDPNPSNNTDEELTEITSTLTPTSTPTSTPTPTPTPTSTSTPTSRTSTSKAPTATPTPITTISTPVPTPTSPVLFLPETGVGHSSSVPWWPLALLPGFGLLVGWAVYRQRRR